MKTPLAMTAIILTAIGFVSTATAALPDPGVVVVPGRTALLITDPQNDFLSPKGVAWGVVGESVTKNNTVENIDSLFEAAKPVTCRCLFHRITISRPITAGSLKAHLKL